MGWRCEDCTTRPVVPSGAPCYNQHMPSTVGTDGYVDLHLHTTWSDGRWSPRRVVEEAAARGLAAISITDHDVLDGLAEARVHADERGIEFLDGVELTADWDGRTVHILGHGIDPRNEPLLAALARGRGLMGEHVERVLAELRAAGEPLDAADLEKYRTRYAGGASLVLAIVERGILKRVPNGIELLKLAGREPRAYSVAEAIALIRAAGGVASLAHPARLRALVGSGPRRPSGEGKETPPLLSAEQLRPLVAAGLDGIEVWQVVHGECERRHYADVAAELGLLVTGGSDCHGPRGGVGQRIGGQTVPYAVLELVKSTIDARQAARSAARA